MLDRLIALVVFIIAAGYLYMASKFPVIEIGDPLGPKVFPMLLGIALVLSVVLLVFESFRKQPDNNRETEKNEALGKSYLVVIIAAALLTLIYITVLESLGYILATFLWLTILLVYLNKNKLIQNLIISLGFTIISYLVFAKLLSVTLPKGLFYF